MLVSDVFKEWLHECYLFEHDDDFFFFLWSFIKTFFVCVASDSFVFRYFNSLQSECFPLCFHSDINMVISAPTGSGKTVLFELCILRLLSKSISKEGRFLHAKGALKTVSFCAWDFWNVTINTPILDCCYL